MSSAPQLIEPDTPPERNWLPVVIACAIVLIVGAALTFFLRAKGPAPAAAVDAKTDPYAASLSIGKIEMSESSNLAGGKVTYIDGHIANQGTRVVTGVTVQVLFRDYSHNVALNETQPLKLIRMRDPYIDVEPVSAAPIKPGDGGDFRLIFDTVPDTWDGNYPEIRVLKVEFQ